MTMRQRGWIPSADRAHRPADAACFDTMRVVVDTLEVNLDPAPAVAHDPPIAPARRSRATSPHITGAMHACPGSFTSDVVSLEVTT